MPDAQKFFDNEEAKHGEVKRVMYKKYLQSFIPRTQKFYQTVITDCFAGAGRYGRNWPRTIEGLGSPLIALKVYLLSLIHI